MLKRDLVGRCSSPILDRDLIKKTNKKFGISSQLLRIRKGRGGRVLVNYRTFLFHTGARAGKVRDVPAKGIRRGLLCFGEREGACLRLFEKLVAVGARVLDGRFLVERIPKEKTVVWREHRITLRELLSFGVSWPGLKTTIFEGLRNCCWAGCNHLLMVAISELSALS